MKRAWIEFWHLFFKKRKGGFTEASLLEWVTGNQEHFFTPNSVTFKLKPSEIVFATCEDFDLISH